MKLLLISDVSNFVKIPLIFLKGFFWQAKGYFVLFFDIHKNYLIAHIARKFHKSLFGFIKLLLWLETRIIHQFIALFAVLLEMSFCLFRETSFRNLKIVDQYTFGPMNWFAVDIKIPLKSLLNMTFHETYMWPFLWPQEFLIESSCKLFIFFHMTSDTNSGSYDMRHFNWKVVWKPNWVKVLYLTIQVPRYSAIVSTVLLALYWQQVSLLEVSPNFLLFSKTTELWFKNSINFIPDLFSFRSTKLLHGISTGWLPPPP